MPSESSLAACRATSRHALPIILYLLHRIVSLQMPVSFSRCLLQPAFVGMVILYGSLLPLSISHAQAATGSLTPQRLAAARKARDENTQRLQSAVVEGTLRQSILSPEREQPLVLVDADLQLVYSAPSFLLRLQYHTLLREVPGADVAAGEERWDSSPWRRQTILFDGQTLSSIQFAEDGSAMGELYFDFSRQAVMRAAGLPFEDPMQLWSDALDVERSGLQSAQTVPLSTGGFVGELDKSTYRRKFYFFGDFGYDLRRVSSYRTAEDLPFRDCLLRWEVQDGVHYVSRLVSRVETALDVPGSRLQLEVNYDSCDINTTVDPQLFNLSALQLPAGTPFDDHRNNVGGKPKRLRFDGQNLVE